MLHPEHLHQLHHQHELVIHLFRNSSSAAWKAEPDPGKWSMHDQLAHLVRYQQVFTERIQQILKTDGAVFGRYDADSDESFAPLRRKNTAGLLEQLLKTRSEIQTRLSSCTADQWNRKGIHPVFGNMSIVSWTEFFLFHESHHLFSIFRLSRMAQKEAAE